MLALPSSQAALGSLVLAQMNDLHGAKEHLEKAVVLGDNNPDVEANLAKVLRVKLGQAEDKDGDYVLLQSRE